MATTRQQPAPRRRRQPEEARGEILTAAAEVIAGGSLDALTVSAVMERTTLSRKSFYVYFDDLAALVVALVRPLRAQADAAIDDWRDADDPVAAGRAALRAAAELYREHGALLAAVLRAPTGDPAIAAARAELTAPLVAMATALLKSRNTVDAQLIPGVAQALATMNVHRLLDAAPGASDQQLAALVDELALIWERTILPDGDG